MSALMPGEEKFQIFVPITKVDEVRREVWGVASVEEVDRGEEVMDYASSKPYFQSWSQDAFKRTGGKSLGNVRAMHQAIAAGKLIHFGADDAAKSFPIGTYISDDQEWRKCLDGTYSGFSVGGKYVRRWVDTVHGETVMRYTAQPNEISVVDVPAVPHATFQLVKADGLTENKLFAESHAGGKILLYKSEDLDTAEPPEVLVQLSGHTTLAQIVSPIVDFVLSKAMPGTPAGPGKRPIDGTSIAQYQAPTSPATVSDPNNPPSTAALQSHHPATSTVTVPVASSSTRGVIAKTLPNGQPWTWPKSGLAKDVQDAPNLRHVEAGSAMSCWGCKFFRYLGDPYCRQYDFPTQGDWTCDTWAIEDGTGGGDEQAHTDAAVNPVSKTDLAKSALKCPNCGADITVEKAGELKCAKCNKMCKAEADGAGYKLSKIPALTPDSDDVTKFNAETEQYVKMIGIRRKDFVALTGYNFVPVPPDTADVRKLMPAGFPLQRDEYADPVNFGYRCDASWSAWTIARYNKRIGLDRYDQREIGVLGRRIARLASRFGKTFHYDPRTKLVSAE